MVVEAWLSVGTRVLITEEVVPGFKDVSPALSHAVGDVVGLEDGLVPF